MICPKCEAITPNSYKLCPNCLTKLERERFAMADKEPEIIEEVSPYVECGELKDGEL